MAEPTKAELAAQVAALRKALSRERAKSVRLTATLTEAREQRAATAGILGVISSSPTAIQPTFGAIAAASMTLCDADTAGMFRFDGELIHFAAHHGRTPDEIDAAQRAFPQPPSRHSVTARAILAAAVVHIADVSEDVGPLALKGLARPVPIWSVRGLISPGRSEPPIQSRLPHDRLLACGRTRLE